MKKQKQLTIVINSDSKENFFNLVWCSEKCLKHLCLGAKIHRHDELKSSYIKEIKNFSKILIQIKQQFNNMSYIDGV